MAREIKVSISAVLTVDPDGWDLAYGTGTDEAVVRKDVQEAIVLILEELTKGQSGAGDGAIKAVKVRHK